MIGHHALVDNEAVETSAVTAQAVRAQLRAAIQGSAPWNVWLGHGTFVFFDFGEPEPSEVPGRPDRGSDQLWIYASSWRIFGLGNRDAGSGDDAPEMSAALEGCIGRTVERVRFDSDLNLSLEFEGSVAFRTLRSSARDDAWTLFRRGDSYSLRGDGRFEREAGSPRS